MPAHYLYSSLTAPVLTGSDEAEKVLPVIDASEAWPVGTRVATVYGSGLVLDFRATDSMYVIQLAFGKAHLSPTVVYGSEQLPPQALQVSNIEKLCPYNSDSNSLSLLMLGDWSC